MVNFATLKKSSNNLERLTQEIEKINTPTTEKKDDGRYWKLERDKSGNGSAVIRFLPAPAVDGDDALPWVRYWDHGFKGPTGKWYIENSLTTLGQKDPVSEYNSKLWAASDDDTSPQRKQARDQKRRLHYVSPILVVSDPKHPENEGKVFLFKYGKKIFDKITLAMNPEFEGDKPLNPFCMWTGANFKVRIRTVDGYPNYEQSVFESPSAISDDEKYLENLWKSIPSLKAEISPDKFKTYAELKAWFNEVMGLTEEGSTQILTETAATKPARKPKAAVVDDEEDPPFDVDTSEEDPLIKQFKALAEQS